MLDAPSITLLQDHTTSAWHDFHLPEPAADPSDISSLIRSQHRANFDLWHEEDKARDPDATDHEIAQVKRAIDRLNQRRNDLVEQIDTLLLARFQAIHDSHSAAPLH